jgi:uncharacterized Zn finger protein (UPF0148 family)
MAELKPCPFCGGEAKIAEYDTMYLHGFVVRCANDGCSVAVETYIYPTEAEAAEVWNTRSDDYRKAADYWRRMFEDAMFDRMGERTCRIEQRIDGWGAATRHCGNCGADLDYDTRNKQNYCPVCGARLEVESQADVLRERARVLRQGDWSDGADDAALMEQAADTIERHYDAGFDNGMKAVLQQLDGLIHEGADVDEIQAWVDRQWEEES